MALNDQCEPESSDGESSIRTQWWPKEDQVTWVQYNWDKPQTLSSSKVYWFDDRPDGGVLLPKSWRLLYKQGDAWNEVEAKTEYRVTMDQYDRVEFNTVTTTGLRLEVQLPGENSSGILEWVVD